jgi:hypothetical protein
VTHQIFSPLDIPDNIPAIWHHSKQCPYCGAPIYYNKVPDGYGIGGTTEQNDGHGIGNCIKVLRTANDALEARVTMLEKGERC